MKTIYKNSLWCFAFSLVILAWIYGLFIDLTGDSGLYAAISRQMTETGDWLNLEINGEPYDQKPHLFFWLAGLGIRLFENTNFAFKLFPFLYGLSSLYFIYRLAKLLFSEKAGMFAALIAGTSQMFFLYFLDIHTDTVLQAGVTLALWQLAAHIKTGKAGNFLFGFLGIGMAMLTKGPLGAVLPFFTIFFYLLLKKDFRQLINPKWLAGILIVVIAISPTLIHLWKNFGSEGIRFYFIDNNLGRITGEVAGSGYDPFYYIYNMIWAFSPWTILVIVAFYLEIKSWISMQNMDVFRAALLGSVLVLFIAFSIAKGRMPNYFMVLIPPLAVVTSGWSDYLYKLSGNRIKKFIRTQTFFLFMIALLFFVAIFIFSGNRLWFSLLLVVVSFVTILFTFKLKYDLFSKTVLISVIIAGSFNLFLNAVLIPKLYSYQGCKNVLHIFEEKSTEGEKLYNFDLEEYELFFYAEDPVINIDNWEKLNAAMKKPGSWLYTNEKKFSEILEMGFEIDTVYEIKHRGMNRITLQFLNPATREGSLNTNFLIKTNKNR